MKVCQLLHSRLDFDDGKALPSFSVIDSNPGRVRLGLYRLAEDGLWPAVLDKQLAWQPAWQPSHGLCAQTFVMDQSMMAWQLAVERTQIIYASCPCQSAQPEVRSHSVCGASRQAQIA